MKTSHPIKIGISLPLLILWLGYTLPLASQTTPRSAKSGILILAHGGSDSWNDAVRELARTVDQKYPTEVALGMAARGSIQQGVDRLVMRGAREIIAVPLFVSPHSSVVTSSEYLLHQRSDMPEELKLFARMNHAGGSQQQHAPDEHGTHPVQTSVPIRMTRALGRDPVVADILLSRAREVSREPASEVVILVAHGPVKDEENRLWLDDMKAIASRMSGHGFHRIDSLTVRDDAPAPARDAAAREFRSLVEAARNEGKRVLIVPLLLSFGGIEAGLRKRLEGLEYTMPQKALLPDARLAGWILSSAEAAMQ